MAGGLRREREKSVSDTTLWIVGQFREQTPAGAIWDFRGVFPDRDSAVAACRGPVYFVVPATLGEALPDDAREWPDVEYPLTEESDGGG